MNQFPSGKGCSTSFIIYLGFVNTVRYSFHKLYYYVVSKKKFIRDQTLLLTGFKEQSKSLWVEQHTPTRQIHMQTRKETITITTGIGQFNKSHPDETCCYW